MFLLKWNVAVEEIIQEWKFGKNSTEELSNWSKHKSFNI